MNKLVEADVSRLHMPGHKGRYPNEILADISRYDITEITGADSLFTPDGIILQSEENTAELYNAKHTCFSTGGSTLCIQTMLALTARPKDKIIAGRNAHMAFINTCALLGLMPFWIEPCYNDSFGVSGEITPNAVKTAIKSCPDAKAVYITSPDYLGCISDIGGIAEICKFYKIPLLVDNAHGAHLKFTREDIHPITLGATLCCDSAHKTLPVLTGGAYLHTSKNSGIEKSEVKAKMSLFGSTSPSYLILMSLDYNNKYLFQSAKKDFLHLEQTAKELYFEAAKKGFMPISNSCDFTKVTLDAYAVGMTGSELAEHFAKYNIECEYVSSRHIVLMLSPLNTAKDIARIKSAIMAVSKTEAIIADNCLIYKIPTAKMSVRDAVFAEKISVEIENSLGKIAAETKIKCPPGVPLIIAGEIIDSSIQKLLKKCSISSIYVVK